MCSVKLPEKTFKFVRLGGFFMRKSIALIRLLMLFFLLFNLDSFLGNAETQSGPLSSYETLSVPESLGKAQERFTGTNGRIVIQVQDVHAHVVAQQNIAAILERLRTVFGVKTVALEGAWDSTSLPQSHAIPTSREKQLLAGTLLEADLISGPIYAAIMSPDPITLAGIEEETLYEKNRAFFLDHFEKAPAIDIKIRTYSEQLQTSQKALWNPELLAFGNAFGKFEETSDYGKFFPVLMETATVHAVDLTDLDQILLTQDILAFEKSLSKERLTKEASQLMRQFKDTPWTLEELIRGNKIPPEKLGFYPEIQKSMQLFKLKDRISLTDLMAQTETLISRILKTLIKTPEEGSLWDKNERLLLAKRILLLKATPGDLKVYDEEKAALEAELQRAGLAAELDLSLKFYELVKKRDEVFYEKIVNDSLFQGPIAIVTGGFHTNGLSQKLRESGISYITISPELGGTPMNEKLYNERMRSSQPTQYPGLPPLANPGIAKGKTETLSELRNTIAWVDEQFVEAYEVLLLTEDVRKAVATFLGETVPISSAQKISYAHGAGKIFSLGEKEALKPTIPALHEEEFMASPRSEQLAAVQSWLEKVPALGQKAMLVSSVDALKKMLSNKQVPHLIEQIVKNGDILVLFQDVPLAEIPEVLMGQHEIERLDAPDFETLLQKNPRFQRFSKKYPFAIMKEGYESGTYVVLPEDPVSLVLYRIVTLSPSLYQAAKNPVFLALLKDLVQEILSQELPGKAA